MSSESPKGLRVLGVRKIHTDIILAGIKWMKERAVGDEVGEQTEPIYVESLIIHWKEFGFYSPWNVE